MTQSSLFERLFHFTAARTNWKRELIAGLTTFAAMSYILVVNPDILSNAIQFGDFDERVAAVASAEPSRDIESIQSEIRSTMRAESFTVLVAVTALAAAFGSIAMGLLTNYPIAQAPGMGLNAFFTYTLCLGMGLSWEVALGLVFWNGVIFLALSFSNWRKQIAEAVPESLKIGVQCGIGLFIAFIGLKNAGIIVDHPATLVTLGEVGSAGPLLALFGIFLTIALVARGIPGGIIIGIIVLTLIGFFVREDGTPLTGTPQGFLTFPDTIAPTFFAFDLLFPFREPLIAIPIIITLLFVDMFDTIGTLIGVSRQANLVDEEGRLPKMNQALTADAASTAVGACLGTSTTTSYIESATGVEAGGRTGMTAVVVGLCFLFAMFLTPILVIVPTLATTPALVMVGIAMLGGIRVLDWNDSVAVATAFITLITMPLAFSISAGIGLGFISFCALMILVGRWKKVSPLVYVLGILFFLLYLFDLTA